MKMLKAMLVFAVFISLFSAQVSLAAGKGQDQSSPANGQDVAKSVALGKSEVDAWDNAEKDKSNNRDKQKHPNDHRAENQHRRHHNKNCSPF